MIRTHVQDAPMPDYENEKEMVVVAPTPLSIVQQFAADPNFDVAKLQALLNLQKDWEANEAKKLFFAALTDCQKAIPAVIRDAKNSQTSSRFATLEAVNKIVRPKLAEFGLAVSFAEADCPIKEEGKIWKRTIADLRHKGGHCERYHIDLPLDGFGAKGQPIGAMNPVQAAVSTGTYGQRVLLCRILNLAIADSDTDGNQPAGAVNKEQAEMITRLILETDSNMVRFLEFAEAKSVAEISQAMFPKCRDELKRKAPAAWKKALDACKNSVDKVNAELLSIIKKMPEGEAKAMIWNIVKNTLQETGIEWSKDAGKFIPVGAV